MSMRKMPRQIIGVQVGKCYGRIINKEHSEHEEGVTFSVWNAEKVFSEVLTLS